MGAIQAIEQIINKIRYPLWSDICIKNGISMRFFYPHYRFKIVTAK